LDRGLIPLSVQTGVRVQIRVRVQVGVRVRVKSLCIGFLSPFIPVLRGVV
jgi:hypothetical protein